LATRSLFQAISAVEGPFGYSEVEGRLTKEDQDLLAALLLSDKTPETLAETGFRREQVDSCLDALDQLWRKSELAELDRRIKEAERTGHLPEALRLVDYRRKLESKRWRKGRAATGSETQPVPGQADGDAGGSR
jgi:hypothetical protein